MNAKDQKKVCDSGFWIIRAGERNGKPIIKAKNLDNPDSWVTIRSDFKSKAERDRYMKEKKSPTSKPYAGDFIFNYS